MRFVNCGKENSSYVAEKLRMHAQGNTEQMSVYISKFVSYLLGLPRNGKGRTRRNGEEKGRDPPTVSMRKAASKSKNLRGEEDYEVNHSLEG